jgi:hypothetical protein
MVLLVALGADVDERALDDQAGRRQPRGPLEAKGQRQGRAAAVQH